MVPGQRGVEVIEMGCGDSKVQVDIGYGWSTGWACLGVGAQKGRFSILSG